MAYSIKPLACDPTRIKGMSEKLLVSHYENNYGGAVNRLNAIAAQLAELDFAKVPGFVINGLKREELIASNSMILHELFFASLADESAPEGELRDALARDFGSFDRWRAEFSAMGKAQGGGSGWVLLTWSPREPKLVNQWAMDHTTTLAGATPILALDMYEHSYHMDYGARAAAYVDAFMAAINWPNVARAIAFGDLIMHAALARARHPTALTIAQDYQTFDLYSPISWRAEQPDFWAEVRSAQGRNGHG
jgi:superoxide dismutase, Fe-Mn family